MEIRNIAGQEVRIHRYNTIIVGAGAAGMNCAKKLYEFMNQKGVKEAENRIAVVTTGLPLGASRMSGSDKQTYYKMGTSPDVADSAEEFAKSLTAGGCCHGDLALAEAIGSLRGFYNLVEAGVPFPHDAMGSYVGYKTDHDPYERATSAGPKTSKFMSECLQKVVERYGIPVYDHQEAAEMITVEENGSKRIVGLVTVFKKALKETDFAVHVFLFENLVLAAGGPGGLYETSVYPKGQVGMHGIAFRAGLAAENFTESQFGLASISFRWNVSGTYMQAIPRIFSTDADGNDEREFLTDFFPTMSKMATNIFLKGYQWPFDPQRIENLQSSLVDIIVFNETQKGRRVFMDFLKNPVGNASMKTFDLNDLEPEALEYLQKTNALQSTPIERLAHMNEPAIGIYKEHNIDLFKEPLEIAVCAQHNNGGFGVDRWWQSNIKHTFIIGEMAGTHGVKRPGGSALNAGQVGSMRAAEYIANVYGAELPDYTHLQTDIDTFLQNFIKKLDKFANSNGEKTPQDVVRDIQSRMTVSGGHIREISAVRKAVTETLRVVEYIKNNGFKLNNNRDLIVAIQAEHLALASLACLLAIKAMLEQGGGSRGSYLVLADDGLEIHPDILNKTTGQPLKMKPEKLELQKSILEIIYNSSSSELFTCTSKKVRKAPSLRKAFEPAWLDYRQGKIFQ